MAIPTPIPAPAPTLAPKQALSQLQQFWGTRSPRQRMFLGAGVAITAALLALFTNLMTNPDYKPLMTDLDPADAQTMTAELAAKKVPTKLSADGKVLSVPASDLDAARLEVAAHPSPHSGRMGFEIFDKVSWGQTEFDEKVNYQRALEGELERTIGTLGGVKSARVHLVMASDSVFLDRERSAKASVTLKLTRGTLSEEESAAIQRLVAGAVEGLKPTDVIITDADSNQSLGATKDGLATGEGLEKQLTQHLLATLGPVVGADHIRASVNVEYEQGTSEESLEKYDPSVSVPLSVQRSDEQTGPGGGSTGVPGASSNMPQGKQAANTQTSSVEGTESSKTENSVFGVNKTVRHSIEPAGRIHRITAALLVDDFVEHKQMPPHGKWVDVRMKRSPEELKQIQDLAQAAIGFDAARGDVISVQDMSFAHDAAAADLQPPSALDRLRKGAADYSTPIRYGALLLLFVLAYLLMLRPIQKQALGAGKQLAAPDAVESDDLAALPVGEVPLLARSNAEELARANLLKQQLAQLVKAEPASSARAVQAWVRGETT
jgi:flagellar M-ring protein FliF